MSPEPIAIIGSGCRFPGSSSSPSRLWELLRDPRDVASKPPKDRFNIDGFYHPDPTNLLTTNAKESYFLTEDVKTFDASFFNIAASEATSLDPQQRLLLETVYESLEAAGLRFETLRGSSTGVFCGVMCADWEAIVGLDKVVPEYAISGLARNNLANRISYFYDWNGPSMSIDTACSSSMVALHQGFNALQNGECSLVAAVGTNLILTPNLYFAASNVKMLSPEGRGRMWDNEANGYARGEGLASVIMKRLSDAIADGDPIECVIRATGVNSDGKTLGLTMPSGEAQERLVRSTYALAGLDPANRPEDRPQYFEAHGTGTQAGDPQEAGAIYRSFFGPDCTATDGDVMYVGSIKTVIGHSEGCAGLAGVIKASMCLQKGYIPPNLHFQSLNPKLEPYSTHLRVSTELKAWPELPPGVPRRVSVNSFGFGGTNAHCVLESYEPIPSQSPRTNGAKKSSQHALLPFVFSAASERSLGAVIEQYVGYLNENPQVNLVDLTWSLVQKRSAHMYRLALYAPNVDELKNMLQAELAARKANVPSTSVSRPETDKKRILGIFTGQGAQWPQMSLDLITSSPVAQGWFAELQASLDELPVEYRPDFSLLDELAAPKSSSRMSEAVISQSLCTATQIVLVNFLSTLGITFDTVVGHSGGEAAAAYAAGIITARDAVRISYLRGRVAHLARANNQRGAMLAAGISVDEATALCAQSGFAGRIEIAACNSPSSVTLSGDTDAIQAAEKQLKSQDRFARLLLIDTAYHSRHMIPCSEQYMRSVKACNIKLGQPTSTAWYSSVYEGQKMNVLYDADALVSEYWNQNMLRPVKFSGALITAITADASPHGLIIEVGPHPSLKGPSLQTISEALPASSKIPYIAAASRGISGVEALGVAIGSLWTHLGADVVDTTQYLRLFDPTRQLSFINNLPTYPFDHSQTYWTESRRSKAYLHRGPLNELLGDLSEDNADGEWRWRNFLFKNKMEYLDGHQIQSQTIFPATGYVAMALEAAGIITKGKSMRLVQIHQLRIDHAISFLDDARGIETLFRMYDIRSEGETTWATFNCHADIGGTLKTCATGQLAITLGEMDEALLPSNPPSTTGMSAINIKEFYTWLGKLGYGYSGLFRGITSLERKLDTSSGILENVALRDSTSSLLMHPALMDNALQALLGAIGAPGDGQLSSIHIPTQIATTTINPHFFGLGAVEAGDWLSFKAAITESGQDGASGDIDLFSHQGHGLIQFEGVHVTPLMQPAPEDDRPIFSEVTWGYLQPDMNVPHTPIDPFWLANIEAPDHACFLFIKEVLSRLTVEDRQNLKGYRVQIIAWYDHVMALVRAGEHPLIKKEWADEVPSEQFPRLRKHLQPILEEMASTLREHYLDFLREKTTMIEVLRKDDLLTRFYKKEEELTYMNLRVGDMAGQLAFRYPSMKILEIGAGTGSATRASLKSIGKYFHSYTFTDISAAFFEDAEAAHAEHSDHMIYKVLDIEQDPMNQGFEEHAYDLVIAANVLHATKYLHQTMVNVRRLLKPGGHLIALEITNHHVLRDAVLFGGFEGWWLGAGDGRTHGPKISVPEWTQLLRDTGFANGFETIVPEPGKEEYKNWCYSTFVAQAVDDRMTLLREPLNLELAVPEKSGEQRLMIVGGATESTSRLVAALQTLLTPYFSRILHSVTIDSVQIHDSSLTAILNVADMDSPCFQELNDNKMKALKNILEVGRRLLWVTAGSEAENPYLGLSKGFLDCVGFEYKLSFHQYLNIVDPSAVSAHLLATTLMRMVQSDFDNEFDLPTSVGSIELQLRFEDNVMKIPRIMNAPSLNHRYAATKRAVHSEVDLQQSIVEVVSDGGQYELVEIDQDLKVHDDNVVKTAPKIQIRVRYSLSLALKVDGAGFLGLVLGTEENTNHSLVAFTDKNASIVSVPKSWSWKLPENSTDDQEVNFLKAIGSAVLAIDIVQQANLNTGLLVHEADEFLQRAIWCQAVAKGVQPHFSTADPFANDSISSKLFFHERSTSRQLAQLLPANLSIVANFDRTPGGIFSRIDGLLQQDIKRVIAHDLYSLSPIFSKEHIVEQVAETFNIARVMATEIISSLGNHAATSSQKNSPVSIDQLPGRSSKTYELEILDWTQTQKIAVRVHPASSQVKLSANKTYLLIGMTGDLGQSLCRWLVTKGARNIVLTSRTPKVSSQWIEEMMKMGARVCVESMDVTDRESILNVDRIIRRSLPPVGGLVNGAMVLQDQMFADVSLESFQEICRPKVQGSLLLEEIYGGKDLDFFILFGSATGIMGNLGQCSYGAATNFMRSLILGRRKQNLVGSIIHPAAVRGVGYISKMGSELFRLMNNLLGSHVVSEKDLHESFAEAIIAGHDPTASPEIISGFTSHLPEEHPGLIWYTKPKAWPLVEYRIQTNSSASTGTLVPIKVQLEAATSIDDATDVVLAALSAKIIQKLHLPEDIAITPDARLTELGADSLVAVDLRNWFIKELGVEIPVLQIQGGSSVANLASSAASKLSESLIPNVPTSASASSSSPSCPIATPSSGSGSGSDSKN